MGDANEKTDDFFIDLGGFIDGLTEDDPVLSAEFLGDVDSDANLRRLVWCPINSGLTQDEKREGGDRFLYYGGLLRIPKGASDDERRERRVEYVRSFVNEDGSVRRVNGVEFVPDGKVEAYEVIEPETGDLLLFLRIPYRLVG
jgi:hypothetical protein